MSYSVIVCDDSRFARQQLIRGLPAGLAREVLTASNGEEALKLLRAGQGELLFLDLNMPGLDGYQVLEAIRREELNVLVIVVSGDIQAQAHQRILELGALAFVQKPLNNDQLLSLLERFGLMPASDETPTSCPIPPAQELAPVSYQESLQEIVNIAMGQAARQLADLLNLFIHLPIPKVQLSTSQRIHQQLDAWLEMPSSMVVSQGFVGSSIAGECLIHFEEQDICRIAPLLGFDEGDVLDRQSLLIELSSMLAGTLLLGLSDLLGLRFSRSHPALLTQSGDGILAQQEQAQKILSVSLTYTIPAQQISCTLLLLLTDTSLSALERRLSLIAQ